MMNLSSGGEDFDDAALDAHLATCAAARAENREVARSGGGSEGMELKKT